MTLLRERWQQLSMRLFPWAWRLAVLALPWQTRWFQEGPRLASYPWEQARLSVYGVEILMLLTVFLGMGIENTASKKRNYYLLGAFFCAALFTFLTTSSLRATTEWWIELMVLFVFVSTLLKRVSLREFTPWFVVSLLPHALLGIEQAAHQRVIGSSLLGIAPQLPVTRGVAVIEADGLRWLRAYGGLPHPNIFGGWLLTTIVFIYQTLRIQVLRSWEKRFYYFVLPLYSIVLVLTYSRSAWVGLALFLVGAVFVLFRKTGSRRQQLVALGLIAISCFGTILFRPQLVFTRVQTEARLEQVSLSERAQGLKNGVRVLQEHPLIGSGLGASSLVIAQLDAQVDRRAMIPIPPHFIPLLVVAELGILGSGLCILLTYGLFRTHTQILWTRKECTFLHLSLPLALFPLVVLDHYTWSYWSGKMLLAVCLFALLKREEKGTESAT